MAGRYATPQRIELARQFVAHYEALDRRHCSRQEWIMLKFSCTKAQAQRLLEALAPVVRCAACGTANRPGVACSCETAGF